jgi:uncharacterized protein (TIGR03084 family)
VAEVARRDPYPAVLRDLAAEHADLDAIVAGVDSGAWALPTPSPGWSVADQIGHLAFFDARARETLEDPVEFEASTALVRAGDGFDAWLAGHLEVARALARGELLEWWRTERSSLLTQLAAADASRRVPWYGPPMGMVSFASARLMETWAHGQDVADALGVTRLPTGRLRHIAHLGVRALPWSFTVNGFAVPDEDLRVELRSPDREAWVWGPDDALNVVRGNALDFCLVVTQRRHPDDLRLEVSGPVAEQWIGIAQAFAGPRGAGRSPGQFRDA